MESLRIVLLLWAAVASLAAHEKHAAAGDYSPPGEAVVIGEGDFRYRLVPDGEASKIETQMSYRVRWGAVGRFLDSMVIRRIATGSAQDVAEKFSAYVESL